MLYNFKHLYVIQWARGATAKSKGARSAHLIWAVGFWDPPVRCAQARGQYLCERLSRLGLGRPREQPAAERVATCGRPPTSFSLLET